MADHELLGVLLLPDALESAASSDAIPRAGSLRSFVRAEVAACLRGTRLSTWWLNMDRRDWRAISRALAQDQERRRVIAIHCATSEASMMAVAELLASPRAALRSVVFDRRYPPRGSHLAYESLCRSLLGSRLTALTFVRAKLGRDAALLFDALRRHPTLHELNVHHDDLRGTGIAEALLRLARDNDVLRVLSLRDSPLAALQYWPVVVALGSASLAAVVVLRDPRGRTGHGDIYLPSGDCWVPGFGRNLTRLDLSGGAGEVTKFIFRYLVWEPNRTLTWLDLSSNRVGDVGAFYLAAAMRHGLPLIRLALRDCFIGLPGVRHLAYGQDAAVACEFSPGCWQCVHRFAEVPEDRWRGPLFGGPLEHLDVSGSNNEWDEVLAGAELSSIGLTLRTPADADVLMARLSPSVRHLRVVVPAAVASDLPYPSHPFWRALFERPLYTLRLEGERVRFLCQSGNDPRSPFPSAHSHAVFSVRNAGYTDFCATRVSLRDLALKEVFGLLYEGTSPSGDQRDA